MYSPQRWQCVQKPAVGVVPPLDPYKGGCGSLLLYSGDKGKGVHTHTYVQSKPSTTHLDLIERPKEVGHLGKVKLVDVTVTVQ